MEEKEEIEDLELPSIIKVDCGELLRILNEHDKNIAQLNSWNSLQAQQIEELEEQVKGLTERLKKMTVSLINAGR